MLNTSTQRNRGDTIVEALLALAIAAFAVGIAYATANKSLDQAITARERNQALNLIQNQITDLRIRYARDPAFSTNFGVGSTPPNDHFCLNDQATDPGQHSLWPLYQNSFTAMNTVTTLTPTGGYNNSLSNAACVRNIPGEGATFYIDITTNDITPASPVSGVNYAVFQVFVRWDQLGGGINQASLFYRPNGSG